MRRDLAREGVIDDDRRNGDDKADRQEPKSGPPLVSAHFVIPYPPGFPIMVPGQVIAADTIEFMRKLDVKEIHGYDASLGLKLIRPAVLEHGGGRARAVASGNSPRRATR